MINQKVYTREQAFQKIKHYCAYQERCHSEVKEKLYSIGLRKQMVEELISELIEGNFLNEERFARQYAGGKFRMNQWGRKKIAYGLKQKNVSQYCISTGLKEINEDDYEATLRKLATIKWNSLKGNHPLTRQAKTFAYLAQKGYEANLVSEVTERLKNTPIV